MNPQGNDSSIGSLGILAGAKHIEIAQTNDFQAVTALEDVCIQLANGLGGKGYFVMTGILHDVQDSVERAKNYIKSTGMLAGCEVIASPHPEMIDRAVYW